MKRRDFLTASLMVTAGCGARPAEVVVYCALDREFAEPVLMQFEKDTGIRVRAKYDAESTKTVGLVELLIREKSRPRCDVFWNNEVMHTIRLERAGVLTAHEAPTRRDFPAPFRPASAMWTGFAARGRVFIMHTDLVEENRHPASFDDLTKPEWKGKVGIAKPLFGTTATQVAMQFARWGADRTRDWLRKLKANDVRILSGNRDVARQVAAGALAVGMTDTDDAWAEIIAKKPVHVTFPDLDAKAGPLLIPNAVSLIANSPNPDHGRKLIDTLLTPETEKTLALGPGQQLPLHPKTPAKPGLTPNRPPSEVTVDFAAAADQWEAAVAFVRDEFTVP